MAQPQIVEKPTEAAMLDDLVNVAKRLEPGRLQSAVDFAGYLLCEQEDEEWDPDEEQLAAIEAFRRGDRSRFRSHEEVWRELDELP